MLGFDDRYKVWPAMDVDKDLCASLRGHASFRMVRLGTHLRFKHHTLLRGHPFGEE